MTLSQEQVQANRDAGDADIRNVKAMWAEAHRARVVADNPWEGVPSTPPKVDRDWAEITDAQVQAILAACPDARWRCLVALCRWAGLRLGEALTLAWQDVDMQGRTLAVAHEGGRTTKKRARVVPIRPELHAELAAVPLDGRHHLLGLAVLEGSELGVGGNDVIHRSEGTIRERYAQLCLTNHGEGLRARHFVDQVQTNEELGLT